MVFFCQATILCQIATAYVLASDRSQLQVYIIDKLENSLYFFNNIQHSIKKNLP